MSGRSSWDLIDGLAIVGGALLAAPLAWAAWLGFDDALRYWGQWTNVSMIEHVFLAGFPSAIGMLLGPFTRRWALGPALVLIAVQVGFLLVWLGMMSMAFQNRGIFGIPATNLISFASGAGLCLGWQAFCYWLGHVQSRRGRGFDVGPRE